MNLCEFPFALLADRAPKGLNTIVFSDRVEGKDHVAVERVWTVTGSDRFGLPIAGDELIYVALMEATREQGFEDRQVHITRYDIVKRLGWPDKGQSYRRLRDGLDRLLGVTIKAERAFWDKAAQKYVSVGFHIIDDYALYDEAPGRKPGRARKAAGEASEAPVSRPLSYVTWNSVIFQSFQAGNIKQLDADFYFSLRSAISRRLFRYLDKKRYDGKTCFRIGLQKLAFEKLGMSRNYFASHIRQELRRAHDELCEAGYLREVEFFKPGKTAAEQVVYHFRSRGTAAAGAASPRPLPSSLTAPTEARGSEATGDQQTPRDSTPVRQLMDLGVTERVARELVRDFGDEVAAQLAYLPHRKANDPAAVLVEAIRNRWEAPASYIRERAEAQKLQQVQAEMQAEDEARRTDEAARELERARQQGLWEALPEAERAAIEREAAEAIAKGNPMVAARPDGAIYRALFRAECMRRMSSTGSS